MCVCPICVSVCPIGVCLSHVSFLFILQLLYLPPPKDEQNVAGGGLFASVAKFSDEYWKHYSQKCVTKYFLCFQKGQK